MKYCTKCGAQMPDDARFCQQCGTKALPLDESASSTWKSDDFAAKFSSYDLTIDPEVLTWSKIRDMGDAAQTITDKQCELIGEAAGYLKGFLLTAEQENNSDSIAEAYPFVLNKCLRLCESGELMIRTDGEFESYLMSLRAMGLNRDQVRAAGNKADYRYRIIADLQFKQAELLKSELSSAVIERSPELRAIVRKMADTMARALEALAKRTNEVAFFPPDVFFSNYDCYCGLMQGLRPVDRLTDEEELDQLSSSIACAVVACCLGPYGGNISDPNTFVHSKMKEIAEKRHDEAASEYWRRNPEAFNRAERVRDEIDAAKADIEASKAILDDEQRKYDALTRAIESDRLAMAENEKKIESLVNRVFGKKRALERADDLRRENDELRTRIEKNQAETELAKANISEKAEAHDCANTRYRELGEEFETIRWGEDGWVRS